MARDRRRFPPPGRMVDIGGRSLHLIESGSGQPAVILESGISASCLNWTRIRSEVARFTLACAYDRAGLGWSDQAESPRLASRLVDELHALLGTPGVPAPYVLVGHSFGGLLVSMFATKYPSEVAGLVLVDPLAAGEWLHPTPGKSRMLGRGIMLARRGAWLARIDVVRLSLALLTGGARRVPKGIARLTSGAGESFLARIVGEVGKMPPEVWPMIQAHWCLPQSFQALAAALEALPDSSAEAARNRTAARDSVDHLFGQALYRGGTGGARGDDAQLRARPGTLSRRTQVIGFIWTSRNWLSERSARWSIPCERLRLNRDRDVALADGRRSHHDHHRNRSAARDASGNHRVHLQHAGRFAWRRARVRDWCVLTGDLHRHWQ